MGSLRGHLIIASPAIMDPNFTRSVVLLVEHGEEGAMGLVLNRPAETLVADAVPELVLLAEEEAPVYVGGPVQPEGVILLAELEQPERAAVVIREGIGLLPAGRDVSDLAAIAARTRIFAGHAGWGPGQLEDEIERKDWIVLVPAEGEIFSDEPDSLWSEVLRRKGGGYAQMATMPPDPSLN